MKYKVIRLNEDQILILKNLIEKKLEQNNFYMPEDEAKEELFTKSLNKILEKLK